MKKFPSKHFNVGWTVFIGWYDIAMLHNVKSALKKRCDVNVIIYNVQKCWSNVVCSDVELNNVRQRQNNVIIFNVDFRNVGQRRNNIANMTIWKND